MATIEPGDAAVDNGATGRLTIAGVHDGPCGIRPGATPQAAFRWARTGPRPELAVGTVATLDGRAYRVRSVERSAVSAGFYVVELAPLPD